MYIRVESGLDDPDNPGHLGHFFDGSSGSHPQTKLSGCDPRLHILYKTGLASGKQVNLGLVNALNYH